MAAPVNLDPTPVVQTVTGAAIIAMAMWLLRVRDALNTLRLDMDAVKAEAKEQGVVVSKRMDGHEQRMNNYEGSIQQLQVQLGRMDEKLTLLVDRAWPGSSPQRRPGQ